MPDTETQTAAALNGARKAAILMVSLGHETSTELIRHLSQDEVRQISAEIARVGSVSKEEAAGVLEEFHRLASGDDHFAQGGADFARTIVTNAFGPEPAAEWLGQIAAEDSRMSALQQFDPAQLGSYLQNEQPQTIALILSQLESSQAARLFDSFAPALKSEVAVRIAKLDRIAPEVLDRIASIIDHKLRNLGKPARRRSGGVRVLADILNGMKTETAEEVLAAIRSQNAPLANTVQELMFVFTDLLEVNQEGMRALLAKADRKLLTLALKGTSEQLRQHFTECMSQRAAEMLREDMEALGPVRLRDVEAAQQQILAAARELEAAGVLNIRGDEQYVV